MQTANRIHVDHLVDLVHDLRPEWEKWLIRSVVESHAHTLELADLFIGVTRAASEPTVSSPKGLFWLREAWRDRDTKPTPMVPKARCTICGKTEDRCMTERPGPDDHVFEVRP